MSTKVHSGSSAHTVLKQQPQAPKIHVERKRKTDAVTSLFQQWFPYICVALLSAVLYSGYHTYYLAHPHESLNQPLEHGLNELKGKGTASLEYFKESTIYGPNGELCQVSTLCLSYIAVLLTSPQD